MAGVDWRDTTARHVIRVVQVSQTNLDDQLGELEGVDLSGSSLEWGYYTDLRTSGKLRVYGEGWERGRFLRVYHEMPDYGYSEVLGTYVVTNDDAEEVNGVWVYELELQSTLQMLVDDLLTQPWVIAKGGSSLDAIRHVLLTSGAHSMRKVWAALLNPNDSVVELDTSLAEDVQATTAQIMKAGQSRLECLFALCKMGNNRLDVSPMGNPVIRRRRSLAHVEPKFRLDVADRRGVIIDGSLKHHTDWLELPDTYAVSHSFTDKNGGDGKSEQREIYGEAHVRASDSHAVANRGYSIVHFESLRDMEPKTASRASEIARQRLKEQSVELMEWDLSTIYLPITEGDVVELVVRSGIERYRGVRRCMVKDVEVELEHMTMSMTLKEVASGDKGDED